VSKHNNLFNSVKFASCFGYSNHHQADISVHGHDMFSQTFQYMDMTCSVLTVPSSDRHFSTGHDMFSAYSTIIRQTFQYRTWHVQCLQYHHQTDISVHGHDMFSAYSTIIRQTFQYRTWHFQCLQYPHQAGISVHGHDMFSVYSTIIRQTIQYRTWHVQCLQYTEQFINLNIWNSTQQMKTIWDPIGYCKHWTCHVHVLKCLPDDGYCNRNM
jgi:hypothetical protein